VQGPESNPPAASPDESFVAAAEQPAAAAPTQPAEPVPSAAAPPAAAPKRSGPSRRVMVIGGLVLLLVLAVGGGAYWAYANQFVSTDNAQVDGDQIAINAPAAGTITDWSIDTGSKVTTNEAVGRVKILSTGPQQVVRSPGTGTVAVNNVVNGVYVQGGTNLATAYDFSKIYLTARVEETDVAAVHIGAPVDVSVDAFPGTPVTGVVEEIQGSSAVIFSPFAQTQSNINGNFQKLTEVIPVKIRILSDGGKRLVPGMNITVHIHKTS
jgi:multidrug resistance efflux pump